MAGVAVLWLLRHPVQEWAFDKRGRLASHMTAIVRFRLPKTGGKQPISNASITIAGCSLATMENPTSSSGRTAGSGGPQATGDEFDLTPM
jgi:hypothetical protein